MRKMKVFSLVTSFAMCLSLVSMPIFAQPRNQEGTSEPTQVSDEDSKFNELTKYNYAEDDSSAEIQLTCQVKTENGQKIVDYVFEGVGGKVVINKKNFQKHFLNDYDDYGPISPIVNVTFKNVTFPQDSSDFFNSKYLTNLKFEDCDTENEARLENMFFANRLIKSIDFSNFDTTNVKSMSSMFDGCNNLTTLDVSKFDTGNVEEMASMFEGCSSLKTLNVSNFKTEKVTNMNDMFAGCSSLTTLNVSNFNTGNVEKMASMFKGCSSLKTLDLSNFETGNVRYMDCMFEGCCSLETLDVSNFNTVNVKDMCGMFAGCSSLTPLDLSKFDTGNVEEMGNMFKGCSSLETLYVSNFETGKVRSMSYMFAGCSSLKTLNVSNFNTGKVSSMGNMFEGCSSLETLDVHKFNTENVKVIYGMFKDCTKLETIKLPKFEHPENINSAEMFAGCDSLKLDNLIIKTGNYIENQYSYYCLNSFDGKPFPGHTLDAHSNIGRIFFGAYFDTKQKGGSKKLDFTLDLSDWDIDMVDTPLKSVDWQCFYDRGALALGPSDDPDAKIGIILTKKFYNKLRKIYLLSINKEEYNYFWDIQYPFAAPILDVEHSNETEDYIQFGKCVIPSVSNEAGKKEFQKRGYEIKTYKANEDENIASDVFPEVKDDCYYVMIANYDPSPASTPTATPTPTTTSVKVEAQQHIPAVKFVAEKGKPDIQTFTVDSTYHINPTLVVTPVRAGYIFDGWYYDKKDSYKIAPRSQEDQWVPFDLNSRIFADITVYAKWKEQAVVVPEKQQRKPVPNTADCD